MHRATIVVDLGFGDAGKGSIVDALTRTRPVIAIVRYNGGAQAAHTVVTADGRSHTFSQFGSGTLVPGVRTHLSSYMLVDPPALVTEARHLTQIGCTDAFARLTVDERARVVTAYHKIANRFRETLRGDARHGSCGMGIGETMASDLSFPVHTVRVGDLRDPEILMRKLTLVRARVLDEFTDRLDDLQAHPHLRQELAFLTRIDSVERAVHRLRRSAQRFSIVGPSYLRRLAEAGELIFEGAQGVLLDEWYGFHPYTTWSTTTTANALAILDEIGHDGMVERLGLLRAYHTRHGAGPFPTEREWLTMAIPDIHNGMNRWQRDFRVGWFDAVLARYAIAVCGGIDSLAVTCLDRFHTVPAGYVATEYQVPRATLQDGQDPVCSFDRTEETMWHVSDLRAKRFLSDLWFQERLTAVLDAAEPVLRPAPADAEAYLSLIERETGVPVAIESWGPTAQEKQYRTILNAVQTA